MELAPRPSLYVSLSVCSLFSRSRSPDSVQLPVVSVMKEVVVMGGSGGARDGQRRNV